MSTSFFNADSLNFADHPRFAKVKIAVLVTERDSQRASVCLLDIGQQTEIPIHTHDPQVDSIFVVAGAGEAFVNGAWQPIKAGDYIFVPALIEHGIRNTGSEILRLFVHHCPALLK